MEVKETGRVTLTSSPRLAFSLTTTNSPNVNLQASHTFISTSPIAHAAEYDLSYTTWGRITEIHFTPKKHDCWLPSQSKMSTQYNPPQAILDLSPAHPSVALLLAEITATHERGDSGIYLVQTANVTARAQSSQLSYPNSAKSWFCTVANEPSAMYTLTCLQSSRVAKSSLGSQWRSGGD